MAWEARSGWKRIKAERQAGNDPIVGMAWEARSGWKPAITLQWHFSKKKGKPAHPEAQNRQRLGQVGLQSGGGLLQHGDRQLLGLAQTGIVAVIADLAMRAPDGARDALELTMGRQAATLAHEAKRPVGRQPGKPL